MENVSPPIRITVDYGEPDAIARAVEAANFDNKYVALELTDIPLVGSGQVVQEVREVRFGRIMYSRELPAVLKKLGRELGFKAGFKLADPLTALRFAGANPDQQRQYPLAALFTDCEGRRRYLYLTGTASYRHLNFYRHSPFGDWFGAVRFLAACEPACR